MKKIIFLISKSFLIFSLIFISFPLEKVNAEDATLEWAKKVGGGGGDSPSIIRTDSSGNLYIVGSFQSTVDFDSGEGSTSLVSAGSKDGFIMKLDPDGTLIWAKQVGGTGSDRVYDISIDEDGNHYMTGTFAGTADFDPGVGTSNLTSAGSNDGFIMKLDPDGNFAWAKRVGGTGNDQVTFMLLDDTDHLNITGWFAGTSDFDPDPVSTSNLTASGGVDDAYILRLDLDGTLVWVKQFGGTLHERGSSILNDSSNNIYFTGRFNGTADFDPGAGTSNLISAGGEDIFVVKLNSSGDLVWAKRWGSTGNDYGARLVKDSSGDIYVSGTFQNTVDFDPGEETVSLTSNGAADVFIMKLDSDGEFIWVRGFGGPNGDYDEFTTIDDSDNIYNVGWFVGSVDFDPGEEEHILASNGAHDDIWILKLDSDGEFIWVKTFGGPGEDDPNGIFITEDYSMYLTGYFTSNPGDFDPGTGVTNLSSAGSNDIWFSKFTQDIISPTLSEVNTIGSTTNQTPEYTFNTDEEGDITYGGSCTSTTTTAVEGNNTITFNELELGTYDDCTITITDEADNTSNILDISTFTIKRKPSSGSYVGGTRLNTTTTPTIPTPTTTNPITGENNNNTNTDNTYISPLDNKEHICKPTPFTKNLKKGSIVNDKNEVKLWQAFLNKYENEKLKVDGIFGNNTENAVKRFQTKYKEYILTPLKLNNATGYIYKSTISYGNRLLDC